MKLKEAGTTKNALRGALRFVDEALADKTIPQSMRDALGHMRASLKASWKDIAKGAKKVDESAGADAINACIASCNACIDACDECLESCQTCPNCNDYVHQACAECCKSCLAYCAICLRACQTGDPEMADDCLACAVACEKCSDACAVCATCEVCKGACIACVACCDTCSSCCDAVAMAGEPDDTAAGDGLSMSASATIELTSDAIMLTEASGSTIPIKIIQAGWGSSGFYPQEVLQRDGPKAFPAGTHMYMNHPTAQEEAARPERSLNDLAAVTTSDAAWRDGPDGPGLYAECKPFSDSAARIKEMAPHIGVSIRASGQAESGEMEGRKGPIIKAITQGKSVDFVTQAGAGGKVFVESQRGPEQSARSDPATAASESTEVSMTEQEKAEMAAIKAENARLKESQLLREAKDIVTSALPASLPALTRTRLTESLSRNPPVKDGAIDQAAFKESIAQTLKDEMAYLAQATGSGSIRGMGAANANEPDRARTEASLVASFQALGMSESGAKLAAKGRN